MRKKYENPSDGAVSDVPVIEYELSNYSKLLEKTLSSWRGQKKLIKKLIDDRIELLHECSVEDLENAIKSSQLILTREGRELAAYFIRKVGVSHFWQIAQQAIASASSANIAQCYGEMLFIAWKAEKNAESEDDVQNLSKHIEEDILTNLVFYAICTDIPIARKFNAAFQSSNNLSGKDIAPMVFRIVQPTLWRSLQAANEKIRYNACRIFLPIYPLVSNNDFEDKEMLAMQQRMLISLLDDDSSAIRALAAKNMLSVLSTQWSTFPIHFKKQSLSKIVDSLSEDEVFHVRLAVYEGMYDMVRSPNAVSATECALKCLFTKKGLNDRNDRVRHSALKLLNSLKFHRFIKVWDVVNIADVLKRLELEKVKSIKKQISKLLLHSLMPSNVGFDNVVQRLIKLGQINRIAVLNFHYIIVTQNLITIEDGVEHIKGLGIVVYKCFRSSLNLSETMSDFSMTNYPSVVSTMQMVVDPSPDDNSEGAKIWQNCSFLLECLIVIWTALRKALENSQYQNGRTVVLRILTKLFIALFDNYKETSIARSVMALGSTLYEINEIRPIRNAVMNYLMYEAISDESLIHACLEAAATWDFLAVLDFLDECFKKIKSSIFASSSLLNESHESNQEKFMIHLRRALDILEHILRSPCIRQNLVLNHCAYVMKLQRSLSCVTEVERMTLERMKSDETFRIFVLYCTLTSILINTAQSDSEQLTYEVQLVAEFIPMAESLMYVQKQPNFCPDSSFTFKLIQVLMQITEQHLNSTKPTQNFIVSLCELLNMIILGEPHVQLMLPVVHTLRSLICAQRAVEYTTDIYGQKVLFTMTNCLRWVGKTACSGFDIKRCMVVLISLLPVLLKDEKSAPQTVQCFSRAILECSIFGQFELRKTFCPNLDEELCDSDLSLVVNLFAYPLLLENSFLLRTVVEMLSSSDVLVGLLTCVPANDRVFMFGSIYDILTMLKSKMHSLSGDANFRRRCSRTTQERIEKDIISAISVYKNELVKWDDPVKFVILKRL